MSAGMYPELCSSMIFVVVTLEVNHLPPVALLILEEERGASAENGEGCARMEKDARERRLMADAGAGERFDLGI
jgi:hypothetical protein